MLSQIAIETPLEIQLGKEKGITQDASISADILQRILAGVEAGNKDNIYFYGLLKLYGISMVKDSKSAAQQFLRASKLGHAEATTAYGVMKLTGTDADGKRDYAEAVRSFREAVKLNDMVRLHTSILLLYTLHNHQHAIMIFFRIITFYRMLTGCWRRCLWRPRACPPRTTWRPLCCCSRPLRFLRPAICLVRVLIQAIVDIYCNHKSPLISINFMSYTVLYTSVCIFEVYACVFIFVYVHIYICKQVCVCNIYMICILGVLYEYGLGVRRDYNLALKYYRIAAEQKYAESIYHLALMHAYGRGDEGQDLNRAKSLFLSLASIPHPPSCYYLGIFSTYGYAGKVDYDQAVMWFELAAGGGDVRVEAKAMEAAMELRKKIDKAREKNEEIMDTLQDRADKEGGGR